MLQSMLIGLGLLASLLPTITIALPTTSHAGSQVSTWRPGLGSQQRNTVEILDGPRGLRKVTYWTSNGVVIIDGDVAYGSEEEFSEAVQAAKQMKMHPGSESDRQRRALSWDAGINTWPGAEVVFAYESEEAEASAGDLLKRGMTIWKEKAPYLKFTKRSYSKQGTKGALVITAQECGGCNAPVGYHNGTMTLNLQPGCPGSSAGCALSEAVHELGHVLGKSTFPSNVYRLIYIILGFFHEHQRPDRAEVVDVLCQNVDPKCSVLPIGKTCCDHKDEDFPGECCQLMSNFDPLKAGPGTFIDADGPYDIMSVMHYRADGFGLNHTVTLVSKDPRTPVPLVARDEPSKADVARLCARYSKECADGTSTSSDTISSTRTTARPTSTRISLMPSHYHNITVDDR